MATCDKYTENYTIKTTYTLSEACEYMRLRDKKPTTYRPVRWVSAKTGRAVSIGYNG